jgi:hypothetical protein
MNNEWVFFLVFNLYEVFSFLKNYQNEKRVIENEKI